MKNLNIIMSIVFCFVLFSCIQKTNKKIDSDKIKEQVKYETGIVLPDFIFLQEEKNQAMGDYAESIEIKFDTVNFNILLKRIENKIKNDSITKIALVDRKGYRNMRWEIYESGYKLENFFPKATYVSIIM
ncbi:MAG: hypothetical protein K8R41_04110 [Bacteroidales bacterium]|nr:hypothetical protein [Bacteroidales bacterium]